jgi:hypothetical protein
MAASIKKEFELENEEERDLGLSKLMEWSGVDQMELKNGDVSRSGFDAVCSFIFIFTFVPSS